ncbi:MTA/SAH nucleosidase like protein [Aduncisulcus paluster]|uniref:adenosylhomocysteine nucleosidase n=1 Tax=Aduncisulcus paluster TaxID=2918883 RepID=A0ABQ5K4I3_9EUKA|nr:MTA/SAH nucleosidase like protein [Aduncisulcus paluster]
MTETDTRIAIMVAITREYELLKKAMDESDSHAVVKIGHRDFLLGKLHGINVVVAMSNPGKVAAAVTATLMVKCFSAAAVIFVGIAGATGAGVRVGDVIVAKGLVQHDLDVRPFYKITELPSPHRKTHLVPTESLTDTAVPVTATLMVKCFSAAAVIFVGIAGATGAGVRVGDVIVAKGLVQHDLDVRPFYKITELPSPHRKTHLVPTESLTDTAVRAVKTFIDEKYHSVISDKLIEDLGLADPVLREGTIATGDQFISSDDMKKKVIENVPDALCVEMEGASVAQVCVELETPYCVIRIVSDSSDGSGHADFEKFASGVASELTYGVVDIMLGEFGEEIIKSVGSVKKRAAVGKELL